MTYAEKKKWRSIDFSEALPQKVFVFLHELPRLDFPQFQDHCPHFQTKSDLYWGDGPKILQRRATYGLGET